MEEKQKVEKKQWTKPKIEEKGNLNERFSTENFDVSL